MTSTTTFYKTHQMNNSDNVAFGATALTSLATTIMAFFNANAAGIGAICTILTFSVYATISYLKWRLLKNAKVQQSVDSEIENL